MKDPTRLLDAASELELRILRAGASEEPPAGAPQRLAAKLGVQLSAAQVSQVSKTGTVASGAAVGAKLTIVLIASALTAAGVVWFAMQPSASTSTSPVPSSSVSRASPPNTEPALQPPAADADLQPRAAETQSRAPLAAGQAPATPEPGSTAALAVEIARVDSIRRLISTNRAESALVALRNYQRDYPRGALRQEATVLEIEALRRNHEPAQARAIAERFLRDNPESPHAPRVRALAFDGANAR